VKNYFSITNVQLGITNYLISEKLKTKKPVLLLTDEKLLITNVQLGITNYLWDIKSVKIRTIGVICVLFLKG